MLKTTKPILTLGRLDLATINNQVLRLDGWVASFNSGSVSGFKVSIAGIEVSKIEQTIGIPSPDIQEIYPYLDSAANARFSIEVPIIQWHFSNSLVIVTPLFNGCEGNLLVTVLNPSLPKPTEEYIALVGSDFEVSYYFLAYFIQMGGLAPTDRVLDIGCGVGRLAYSLAYYLKRPGSYEGFDIIGSLIDWAQKNITPSFPLFKFRPVNIYNQMYNPTGTVQAVDFIFPYADESFDFIFLTSVFTHMQAQEVQHYLEEINRVLKLGGRCLCTCFLLNEESELAISQGRSTLNISYKLEDCFTNDLAVPESAIGYKEALLLEWMEDSGLEVTGKYYGYWSGRSCFTSMEDIVIVEKKRSVKVQTKKTIPLLPVTQPETILKPIEVISSLGSIDVVELNENQGFCLYGWAASLNAGAPDGFKLLIAGKEFVDFELTLGIASPDVKQAYPDIENTENSRFILQIPFNYQQQEQFRNAAIQLTPLFKNREGQVIMNNSSRNNPWNSNQPFSASEMWFAADECNRTINHKIAGENISWLEYVMKKYLAPALGWAPSTKPRHEYRCLLLGANEGHMELALCQQGFIGQIIASDIAEKALSRAKQQIEALGYTNVDYVIADLNTDSFEGKFDYIIAEGVLHHISNIDGCLQMLNSKLLEDSFFIAVEFVGPFRFQLPEIQVRWINTALSILPKSLRPIPRRNDGNLPATPEENLHNYYKPPSEQAIIDFDPSEAICGPMLKKLLPEVFEILEKEGFGGTLLSYMTHYFDFRRANHDEFTFSWLKILIQIEDTLIQNGILDDEFVFYVMKRKISSKSVQYIKEASTESSMNWKSSQSELKQLTPIESQLTGWLEATALVDNQMLRLDGWAASHNLGSMDGVKIYLGGREVNNFQVTLGIPSSDVKQAYPNLVCAENARFSISIDLNAEQQEITPESTVTLTPLFREIQGTPIQTTLSFFYPILEDQKTVNDSSLTGQPLAQFFESLKHDEEQTSETKTEMVSGSSTTIQKIQADLERSCSYLEKIQTGLDCSPSPVQPVQPELAPVTQPIVITETKLHNNNAQNLRSHYPNLLGLSEVSIEKFWQIVNPIIESQLPYANTTTPKISILTPTWNSSLDWFVETALSVLTQSIADWEWCIADDGSKTPEIRSVLADLAKKHPRIKIAFKEPGGISSATNHALNMASADYVCFLDHDDTLAPTALQDSLDKLSEGFDAVYSDEDKIDFSGLDYVECFFKPDWSPEYFRGVMYAGHLLCVRRELALAVGGFKSEYDGVQDYEFLLRISEGTNKIGHISKMLYHWRKIRGSIAGDINAKAGIEPLQQAAVNSHLQRLGLPAKAEPGVGGHRVNINPLPRNQNPLVSIIIAVKDAYVPLEDCLKNIISQSTYPNFEVLVVESETADTPKSLNWQNQVSVKSIKLQQPFTPARAYNLGSKSARGEYLVFLSDIAEILTEDWLRHLLYYAEQPDVGAVGSLLLSADRIVQHAGLVLGDKSTVNWVMKGFPSNSDGYAGSLVCAREVSAVTDSCMMVKKSEFERMGGFSEHFFTQYQDIDFCLRLKKEGKRIILTPRSVLISHEPGRRQGYDDSVDRMLLLDHWEMDIEQGDSHYNPNFDSERNDYTIRA